MVEHGFFVSAGGRLATVTHRPPGFGSGSHRAAVLAHGLANDYDEAGQFPPLAERLAEEGFVVLRFDFRGGRRDSLAGRQLPATEWTHDLRSAIAHTRTRAGVDPERLPLPVPDRAELRKRCEPRCPLTKRCVDRSAFRGQRCTGSTA